MQVANLPLRHHSKPPEIYSDGYRPAAATWEKKWLTGRAHWAVKVELFRLDIKESHLGPILQAARPRLRDLSHLRRV